jgi:thiamine biosynthesis protein ThiS
LGERRDLNPRDDGATIHCLNHLATSAMLVIYINGQLTLFKRVMTLQELLDFLKAPLHLITVELNGKVVPSGQWKSISLKSRDRLEIITFAPGG